MAESFIEMALAEIERHIAAAQAASLAIVQPRPANPDPARTERWVDTTAYEALLRTHQQLLTDTQVLIDEVRHLKALVPPYPAIPTGQILPATLNADSAYQQRARSK